MGKQQLSFDTNVTIFENSCMVVVVYRSDGYEIEAVIISADKVIQDDGIEVLWELNSVIGNELLSLRSGNV